jgi:cyclopropane-fatty-acyl-phospholipid synthase
MATQAQIDATYNYMDEVWRHCLGQHADISGAMYDGDFSLSLEQAQRKKHDFIITETRLPRSGRLLDIGCGWGALLNTVRDFGARGSGLTLSRKQFEHCKRTGLDARLRDWKDVTLDEIGPVDAISSAGAFEHFCV